MVLPHLFKMELAKKTTSESSQCSKEVMGYTLHRTKNCPNLKGDTEEVRKAREGFLQKVSTEPCEVRLDISLYWCATRYQKDIY